MRVIFAGTPEFAAEALKDLIAAGFEVVLVLTQPDRPAGRGLRMHPSPVKQCALDHGIPVAQPVSLRLDGKYPDVAREAHAVLRNTPHDVMVVAAYGLILPQSILDIPPHGCINIHASLLPRWRGAAPIHRAIEAGDSETGITIMQMDAGLDTGAMLAMQRTVIAPDDTTALLHDRLAALGGVMIVDVLRRIAAGEDVPAVAQPSDGLTYAAKIAKEEAALDFSLPAEVLDRKIRAFDPFPGAVGVFNEVPLKIWRAEVMPGSPLSGGSDAHRDGAGHPGMVLAADAQHGILVWTGSGLLRLHVLQKPGGKRLPAEEFIKAFPLAGGSFSSVTAPRVHAE